MGIRTVVKVLRVTAYQSLRVDCLSSRSEKIFVNLTLK